MARRVYEIAFEIGGKLNRSLNTSMMTASGQLDQLGKKIRELETSQGSVTRFRALKNEIDETKTKLTRAEQEMQALRREIEATDSPTQALTNKFAAAERRVDKLQGKLREQRTELRGVRTAMNEAGVSVRNLAADNEQLARQLERVTRAQRQLREVQGSQAANLQNREDLRGQMFDAAGMAFALAIPIREAVRFESTLADLNKVANLSTSELGAMERKINDLAVQTGIARDQVSQMYEAAAQAGFARSEWDAYVDTASKMSVAFGMAGQETGDMLRAWRSGMALTMDQATALGNTVNHLSNNLNANAKAIGIVIQRQGAVAMQAGLTQQEVAGLSAALLSGGSSPEIAATALKNLTGALTDGEAATSRQREALEALGLDAVTLAKRMQTDATAAIEDVFIALNQAPEYKRNSLVSLLFGEESKGAIMPLIGNLEVYTKSMGMAGDVTNSMLEEYNTRSKTTEQRLKRMREQAKVLAGTVGKALLPALNQTLQALIPMVGAVADLMAQYPNLTKVVVTAAAGLVALKIAAIAGGFAFTYVKGAVLAVRKVMLLARTAWLLHTGAMAANTVASKVWVAVSGKVAAAMRVVNAVMRANPIGMVITLIGGLIAAGVYLWRNWDEVKAKAIAVWNAIPDAVRNALSFIGNIIKNFSPAGWFYQAFMAAVDVIKQIDWSATGAAIIDTIITGIKSKVGALTDSVKDAFSNVRDYLPFSDAKRGPFSDLTLSGQRIVTTIGKGVATAPKNAITKPLADRMGMPGSSGGGLVSAGSGLGGGRGAVIHIQYAPNLSVAAGTPAETREAASQGLRESSRDLERRLKGLMRNEERLSYA